MTTFSKLFAERAKNLTCKDVTHPDFDSCLSFHWWFIWSSIAKSLKYLAPIFLIPMAANFGKTSLKEFKEKMETYLKMAVGVSGTVSLAFVVHCILCKISNEHRYYNISAMPMFIATVLFVNYLPQDFAKIQYLFINNLLVQTMLRTSDYPPLKTFRESRMSSTLLFMALSSLIMGLKTLTKNESHRYWYAQNFEVKKSKIGSQDETMAEKVDLLKNLIHKQMMSTVKMALLMSSIKVISKSAALLRKSLFQFMISFVQNFDYKLLGLFATYGAGFQVFNFLLNDIQPKWKPHLKTFFAGFLAGGAFYISPRYFLFTYALTAVIELLMVFVLNKFDQSSTITKFLKNAPWAKLLTLISLPTFTHWRVVRPWLVPKIIDEITHVFGNDRLAVGSQNYAKYILRI